MFYADRDYSYKYKIDSSLFESKFDDLVKVIEKTHNDIKSGRRILMHCTDVGVNKIFVEYEDGSKTSIEFYCSMYENQFDEIANIIRTMIPSCEQISEYLMTEEELDKMYNPDGVEEDD